MAATWRTGLKSFEDCFLQKHWAKSWSCRRGREAGCSRGYSDVCASHVNAWRVSEVEERSSWQEQEKGSSVPHLTMQTCEPSSLSLSWPAAKLAIPMLTSVTGNTKRLITIWEAVHSLQYLPQRYPRATHRGERQRQRSCSGAGSCGGSGTNPPLAPGTWPQLPDRD